MKILIDLFDAELDVSMTDVYDSIKLNRGRLENSRDLEAPAIVSRSRFAKILADTYSLLVDDLPIQFDIFSTLTDVIKWLGLSDKAEEILEIKKRGYERLEKRCSDLSREPLYKSKNMN